MTGKSSSQRQHSPARLGRLCGIVAALALAPAAPAALAQMPAGGAGAGEPLSARPADPAAPEAISVPRDFARLVALDAPAGTVVLGDDTVADVALANDRTLVLTGRAAGQTNLIVLGPEGAPVLETVISVTESERTAQVAVHRGGERLDYVCAPDCAAAPTRPVSE